MEFIALLLFLVGYWYLLWPLVFRFQMRFPARPDLQPLGFDSLDPAVSHFLTERSEAVLRLGFDERTLFRVDNSAPNVVAYFVMLINRERGDQAMISFEEHWNGFSHDVTTNVQYCTQFKSGRVFNTQNSRTPPTFRPPPQATRTQTPSVQDPEELYRLHQFVMDRDGAEGPKVMYDEGNALDYLLEYVFIKRYVRLVARRMLYYRPDKDDYRLTLPGAFWLAWTQLPPLMWLRKLLLIRREKVVLREFRSLPQTERP